MIYTISLEKIWVSGPSILQDLDDHVSILVHSFVVYFGKFTKQNIVIGYVSYLMLWELPVNLTMTCDCCGDVLKVISL